MKYHILLILLSVLTVGCKPGKKLKKQEKVSTIAAQSGVSLRDYRLNKLQSIMNSNTTSGLFFYPIDPTKESYVKFREDSSVTTKNAAVNLTKKDKTEVINTHTKAQSEHTEATEHTTKSNINRHTAEQTISQAKDFRKLIVSLIVLVIALIGYMLIRKRR